MPMLGKALRDLSISDLKLLCATGATEDEQIDFKETIPHKDGEGRDLWRERRTIKEYGRDQLLAAVVAFANSYGGDLLVGVSETKGSQPGKADALTPLPAAADAGQRLMQAAQELIEPPIAGIEVRAIGDPDTVESAGVLVIRVPRSRSAPHRLRSVKECYHRVRHETLPMTMRQVQDLTFAVARGLEGVNRRFDELRLTFLDWAAMDRVSDHQRSIAVRVTCVPGEDSFYLDRVHKVEAVRPQLRRLFARIGTERTKVDLYLPFDPHPWRPVLRGTSAEQTLSDRRMRIAVYCDGSVIFELARTIDHKNSEGLRHQLYPTWVFALLVNAVEALHAVRTHAGAAAVPYGLELQVLASRSVPVMAIASEFPSAAGTMTERSVAYPRYHVGGPDQWRDLYGLMWTDFWASVGVHEEPGHFDLIAPST